MICDYHIHSSFSADSAETVEAHLSEAEKQGLDEICFTEHVEYDFHRGDWHADLKNYKETLGNTSSSIRFKVGAEIGLSCSFENLDRIQKEVRATCLDFVLASLHELNGGDPMQDTFFPGKNISELTQNYFRTLYERICLFDKECISSVAHIDYLSKGYGPEYYKKGRVTYEDAPDEIDAILTWIINNGKCLEINTSTWPEHGCPSLDWLNRYVELGGKTVTFGSDAHKSNKIGRRIKTAQEYAKECGIKYFATFDKMKPIYHCL